MKLSYGQSCSWHAGILYKSKKAAKIRKRFNQVPHLTQNTTWESNKNTINITNKSLEVSPFPAGDHKAAMNRRESTRNTRHKNTYDPQKKYHLWTVSKNILLEGLNQFHGANLTLDSDVDQGTFGNVTKHNTHGSQEVRPFPAGDHKATKNRHNITTHTNMKHNHKRSTALERSVKILLLEGLYRFHGANLTLSSDVDQDT